VVVNTGDDFQHLGLRISPDLDTVLYTLSDLNDEDRGWGRADESWNFMAALSALGGETWFRLGDRDLAIHVQRTQALSRGASLTEFTQQTARRLGIAADILPMSDGAFATVVVTAGERLPFQRYFVELGSRPVVARIDVDHGSDAGASPQVLRAFRDPQLEAVIICPSNPWLSIDPILRVPGVVAALTATRAPVVAVSPLIGGEAVKGPTAKIMRELGVTARTAAIASHYPFLDGIVIDDRDRAEAEGLDIPVHVTATLMRTRDDRVALAAACLSFAAGLGPSESEPEKWTG
jgi:LPPG:FO 2-phospho-L-lactate transferase